MPLSRSSLILALHALQNAVHTVFPEGLPASLRAADVQATDALGGPEPAINRGGADFAALPWRVGGTREGVGPQGVNDRYIRDAPGRIVAAASEGSLEQGRALAERIVACVNACEGITDAQLADFSLRTFRESAMGVVRRWEHGDLAGAVSDLHYEAEKIGGEVGEACEDGEAVAG